jgi:peptidyl-prolyl cis-trans isomerase A (cyclophilin A)
MSLARLASVTFTFTFTFALASSAVVACLDRPPGLPVDDGPPQPVKSPSEPGTTIATVPPSSKGQSERPRDDGEHAAAAEDRSAAASADGPVGGPDPLGGKFTLTDATAGLVGSGPLMATIKTNKGEMHCKLYDDKAPITVANFVGLARGIRPFKSHVDGRWVKNPFYDGTTFHRVIKGFMVQGGDPKGNGTGDPGYEIPDEIWPGATHDRAGLLCMANRGPNTNGAQFFITEAPVTRLDGNYTIFGACTPTSVVTAIASVPKGQADKPISPVTIDKIEISR